MRSPYMVAVLLTWAAGLDVCHAADLTVDAVTRATELNPNTGNVAVLIDGLTPDTDPQAAAFGWNVAGFLVVEWTHPVILEKIRVYLGDIDRVVLGQGFVVLHPPGMAHLAVNNEQRVALPSLNNMEVYPCRLNHFLCPCDCA